MLNIYFSVISGVTVVLMIRVVVIDGVVICGDLLVATTGIVRFVTLLCFIPLLQLTFPQHLMIFKRFL